MQGIVVSGNYASVQVLSKDMLGVCLNYMPDYSAYQ